MQTTSSPTGSRLSDEPRAQAALAAWLFFAALFVAAAFYSRSESGAPEDALYDADLAVGGLIFYGILLALAFGIGLFFRQTRAALGFRTFQRRWLWWGLGVALATIVVSLVLEPLLHGGQEQGLAPDRWEPEHAGAFAANAVVTVLLGPFAEEVFFRGLGVRVLALLGTATALVGSAVIFGLVHGLLVALPPLVLFGLGLAWVRLRSGSVWPTVAAHVAYNGLGIVLLIISWAAELDTPA